MLRLFYLLTFENTYECESTRCDTAISQALQTFIKLQRYVHFCTKIFSIQNIVLYLQHQINN